LSISKDALEKELETINSLSDEKKRLLKEAELYQQQIADYKFENQKVLFFMQFE
jgi:hypothetical protein